jgi:photosystem II stability/assembly factor-like uncharacterized protein
MARTVTPGRSTAARSRTRTPPSRRPATFVLAAVGALVALGALATFLFWPKPPAGATDAIGTLHTLDYHALALSPSEPNVVFFGHHNGMMRSDDGGRTWRPLVDRPGFDAMNLAVSRANPGQIYLAGHEVFQISTDAGATWRPVDSDLPGLDIHGFAMDPNDPNRLTAFVAGRGTFQSADGGRAWDPLGARLPADVTALASAGGHPEVLYAGSQSRGVLKSSDDGQTFAIAGGLDAGTLSLAVDPTAPQTVYAGVADGRFQGGMVKTTDGGLTWRQLPFPASNAVAVAVSSANPNVVLAIAVKERQGVQVPSEGLVFRSEDGGQSWGTGRSAT